MYTTDHIFPVLPIKYLINKYGKPNTPFKIATCTKLSVSHLRVLFCPCVVRKSTAHAGKNVLNMRHHVQKGFCSIFIAIPQHKKGYLVYVPRTRKIISSYNVAFDESFSNMLSYTSQTYAEVMAICPAVSYTPYATSSRGETGDILTIT